MARIDPTIEEKISGLRRAACYPHPVGRVAVIETHMACVFLAGDFAYKLKKPFHRNGIDYRTLAGRRLNCRRELRLNQRLAPSVYLAVLPLTQDQDGRIAVDGQGRVVDWLLKMRRLPSGLALDRRLPTPAEYARFAREIVASLRPLFVAEPSVRWSAGEYARRLQRKIRGTRRQLLRRDYGMDAGTVRALAQGLDDFVSDHLRLLDERVRSGRIVEGHGDLRPEHIYRTVPPTIVDCIEFDRDLRLRDPVEELAFLALELERLRADDFGACVLDEYASLSGDRVPGALIHFYQALNAFVRAKIAVWHIDDPETGPRDHWVRSAKDYLDRAGVHLARAGSHRVQSTARPG